MWLSALMIYVLDVKEQFHSAQMRELPSTTSLVKSKSFFLFEIKDIKICTLFTVYDLIQYSIAVRLNSAFDS